MESNVWTKGGIINQNRPDSWTEKTLLKYINKSPFDRLSKKLNITTSSESSYNPNDSSTKFIKIKETTISSLPYFIKIDNKEHVVYSVQKNDNNMITEYRISKWTK